ncbi:hypothetical protein KDK95_30285 [Actinospica sp. MGRD01-02]|uniref:RAMA domain-containing protein n=1 Tax=Actinospica acidithermotolerans TaxID=2828514 RepID=A0A941EN64_9ACTN|nr:hypothetical protein [Actinospica acidithermotolerans]MBR7830629.1 hypothetical protein [Actinospica acidithermotolerans]
MTDEHTRTGPGAPPPIGAIKDPEAYIELDLGAAVHARIWVYTAASAAIGQLLAFATASTGHGRTTRSGLAPQLAPLIDAGLLHPGQELTWHRPRLKRTETVTVTVDGRIELPDGTVWPSPFQAAHRIAGHPTDGWVRFKTADGRSLKDLRALLETGETGAARRDEPAP